jgi:hypothetical protein
MQIGKVFRTNVIGTNAFKNEKIRMTVTKENSISYIVVRKKCQWILVQSKTSWDQWLLRLIVLHG